MDDALYKAVYLGSVVRCRDLLDRGANVNVVIKQFDRDHSGRTPLWYAAEKGHVEVCRLFWSEVPT